MRFYSLLLIMLLILGGCATQKLYISKGIAYPEPPARELDALVKLDVPDLPQMVWTNHYPGELLSTDSRIYCPISTACLPDSFNAPNTSQTGADHWIRYSTIYAIDKSGYGITDSLTLKDDSTRLDFKHLVRDKDQGLLIIGTKDTLCHIIRASADLTIGQEYATPIRADKILFAGKHGDKLRIVAGIDKGGIFMHEYDAVTMNLERKRLLLNSAPEAQFDLEGQNLWVFLSADSQISTIRFDLSAADPIPAYKEFPNPITNAEQRKHYSVNAADSMLYIQTHESVPDAKNPELQLFTGKFVAIDYDSGQTVNTEPGEPRFFDTAKVGDTTYYYNVDFDNARFVHTLAETSPALDLQKKLISFLPGGYTLQSYSSAVAEPRIFPAGDKIYLAGYYYQKPATAKAKANKVTTDWKQQLFIAAYPLR